MQLEHGFVFRLYLPSSQGLRVFIFGLAGLNPNHWYTQFAVFFWNYFFRNSWLFSQHPRNQTPVKAAGGPYFNGCTVPPDIPLKGGHRGKKTGKNTWNVSPNFGE